MIKRTLYFGNPAYLSLKLKQLVIKKPDARGDMPDFGAFDNYSVIKTIPIEDLGFIILDHPQVTITQALIEALLENNCAIITCDSKHLPVGLVLPLCGNTLQNERFRQQINASLPLLKQLWQQTISCKIHNQASILRYTTGETHNNMLVWSNQVRSGDIDNMEARAAAYYWKTVFPDNSSFIRGQDEGDANNLLNYGYSVLRAIIARSLVASGLLPTLGIHHHNRYDAYCLADDIMEPYRPFVDKLVYDMLCDGCSCELTTDNKARLLELPTVEVKIDGLRRPLMIAAGITATSLSKCYSGVQRRLVYPIID